MLDIGFQEMLVLMVIALLVFGPDKLPELGRRLGRAMREFRRASDEFRSTVETNLQMAEDALLPPLASDPTAPTSVEPLEEAGHDAGERQASSSDPVPTEVPVSSSGEALPEADRPPEEPLEPFWTRRGGRLLHRSACPWGTRVPEADRVALKAATDGWDLGLDPCPVCNPQEAEITS